MVRFSGNNAYLFITWGRLHHYVLLKSATRLWYLINVIYRQTRPLHIWFYQLKNRHLLAIIYQREIQSRMKVSLFLQWNETKINAWKQITWQPGCDFLLEGPEHNIMHKSMKWINNEAKIVITLCLLQDFRFWTWRYMYTALKLS